MDISPEAYFDCLLICDELGRITGGAGEFEIANLSYLSCLLSTFDGKAPSEWGYDFVATNEISPFSSAIASATKILISSGSVEQSSVGLTLTERGRNEISGLADMKRFSDRRIYIDAACRSAIAIPLPLVTESLTAEPQLKRAAELETARQLLDESGRHALMEHFAALYEAVPDVTDLLVPAVVWLSYLASQSQATQEREEETNG